MPSPITIFRPHWNASTQKLQVMDVSGDPHVGGTASSIYCTACPGATDEWGICDPNGDEDLYPKYGCFTVAGIKRCSDDSIIDTQTILAEIVVGGSCGAKWEGDIVIDGTTYTVCYVLGDGWYVFDAANILFKYEGIWGDVGVEGSGASNSFGVGDCGNSVGCEEQCAFSGSRTIVGYGGSIDVCNPADGTGDMRSYWGTTCPGGLPQL